MSYNDASSMLAAFVVGQILLNPNDDPGFNSVLVCDYAPVYGDANREVPMREIQTTIQDDTVLRSFLDWDLGSGPLNCQQLCIVVSRVENDTVKCLIRYGSDRGVYRGRIFPNPGRP